jgi:hypothetical protein
MTWHMLSTCPTDATASVCRMPHGCHYDKCPKVCPLCDIPSLPLLGLVGSTLLTLRSTINIKIYNNLCSYWHSSVLASRHYLTAETFIGYLALPRPVSQGYGCRRSALMSQAVLNLRHARISILFVSYHRRSRSFQSCCVNTVSGAYNFVLTRGRGAVSDKRQRL